MGLFGKKKQGKHCVLCGRKLIETNPLRGMMAPGVNLDFAERINLVSPKNASKSLRLWEMWCRRLFRVLTFELHLALEELSAMPEAWLRYGKTVVAGSRVLHMQQ